MTFVLVVVMLHSMVAVHGFPSMATCEASIPAVRQAFVDAGGPMVGAVACLPFAPIAARERGA